MECETCGNDKGETRIENGLSCGIHCEDCFVKMIDKCRRRSF